MRLWHYQLLPYLDRVRIIAQLRECVAIAKDIHETGKTNHILINPIMDYPTQEFQFYCEIVIQEMKHRGYNIQDITIKKLEKYLNCKFPCMPFDGIQLFDGWHDSTYLVICLYNLKEKFLRGGVTEDEWDKIYHKFYKYLDY